MTAAQQEIDPLVHLLDAEFFARLSQPRFRGEIYDDDTESEHLTEFLACHFHRKIMRDALKDTTLRQGLRAANQIGKTRIGECIVKHKMKYFPANTIIYDETIEKSRDHMANRFGPMLESIPYFSEAFKEVVSNNRFDITTQNIRLPGMIFRARPLNEAWTQSITVKYGMISDAALCEAKQIRRAFVRSRQHEGEDFWFVESQGDAVDGEKGGGFKEFMGTTNEMKLLVRCPACQTRQRFVFHHLRNSETQIVAPIAIPSLDREAWIAHNKPILLSPEREHCGFKVEGELKRDDGSVNEQQIMRATVYECPHCGDIWRDDGLYGETRRYLDREAGLDDNWIATNPKALAGYLGYSLPVWINPKISWGSAMLFFRQAMVARAAGSMTNLQEWRTKWEGEDWDDSEERRKINSPIEIGSYETDPEKLSFPLEQYHSRKMTVDCGKHEGIAAGNKVISKLFFEIRDWSKTGDSNQLARGMIEGKNPAEVWDLLAAQQRYWKVPCRRVAIDAAWMPSQVMEAAAKHFELVPPDKTFQLPSTWRLFFGSSYNRFGKKSLPYIEEIIPGAWRTHDTKGKLWSMTLTKVTWSNYVFEDQLVRILLKTASVKWTNLPREKVIIIGLDGKVDVELTRKYLEYECDTSTMFRSWDSGLDSRHLDEKNKKYLDTYKGGHWTEPRDLALMQMVGAAVDGLLGHVGVSQETETKTV